MELIKDKIFLKTKDEAFNQILEIYKNKLYCIVNFVYFASLSKYILEEKNSLYQTALENSDLLLPDGIALKIYLKKKFRINIKENLNGTDFVPYFLNKIRNKKVHIGLYSVYDEKIGKTKQDAEKIKEVLKVKFGFNDVFLYITHYKNRGKDFNFDKYRQDMSNGNYELKIFLNGTGTPFQEVWIGENLNFFKENNIIVFNVGGLFDFLTGFEKRAPKIVRKLNLEWAWRLIQNPKKNWNKVKESFKLFREIVK